MKKILFISLILGCFCASAQTTVTKSGSTFLVKRGTVTTNIASLTGALNQCVSALNRGDSLKALFGSYPVSSVGVACFDTLVSGTKKYFLYDDRKKVSEFTTQSDAIRGFLALISKSTNTGVDYYLRIGASGLTSGGNTTTGGTTGGGSVVVTPTGLDTNKIAQKVLALITPLPQGPKGDAGVQGLQGQKGDKGDTGNQGLQGIAGVNGTDASLPSPQSQGILYGQSVENPTTGVVTTSWNIWNFEDALADIQWTKSLVYTGRTATAGNNNGLTLENKTVVIPNVGNAVTNLYLPHFSAGQRYFECNVICQNVTGFKLIIPTVNQTYVNEFGVTFNNVTFTFENPINNASGYTITGVGNKQIVYAFDGVNKIVVYVY